MQWKVKRFDELTTEELYTILRLRSEIFVVEQNCIYQDIDNKDVNAFHVLGLRNNKIIAYARIFKAGKYFDNTSIGRILVQKNQRSFRYGYQLVEKSIEYINKNLKQTAIEISAQTYLIEFYKELGFITKGEEYLEDGIPHIKMIRENNSNI